MRTQRRDLMLDLADEHRAARRDATLLAGGRVLRRKRARRVMMRAFAVIAVLIAGAWLLPRPTAPRPPVLAVTPAPPSQPKAMTDQELLALFPDTPVALASLDNGKKRLIFPRPGDEERFVTRM